MSIALVFITSSLFAQRNNLLPDMPSALPVLKMVRVQKYERVAGGSVYADVMNHCDPRGMNQPVVGHSRPTNAHETAHMVHANMRNSHGGRVAGIYLLNGKGVILKEPGIKKSWVSKFVPASLRESKHDLYILGNSGDEDAPIGSLCDEWNAYIIGCLVAMEDKEAGISDDDAIDRAEGNLELGIYCVAMAMAIEKYDRDYWDNYPEFKTFMAWQWKRAKEVFGKGSRAFPFHTQDELLKNLRESPDAEDMRKFIKTHLNGAWLDEQTIDKPQKMPNAPMVKAYSTDGSTIESTGEAATGSCSSGTCGASSGRSSIFSRSRRGR